MMRFWALATHLIAEVLDELADNVHFEDGAVVHQFDVLAAGPVLTS